MDSDSIVLDTTDHGESDLIITFFCAESGRLSAIAKGAKKSKKRFVNKLEPFTFLRIHYEQKTRNSLAFLREAELHTSFPNLRKNITLYGVASILREFLMLGIKEAEPEHAIFRLSLWAFHHLDREKSPKTTLALFLIKFFGDLGYRPDLEACCICNQAVRPELYYRFHPSTGRITCSQCEKQINTGLPISNGTIKMLHVAQDIPLEKLHRVNIAGTCLKEALVILHNFGREIFQRDIVSWKVLRNGNKVF